MPTSRQWIGRTLAAAGVILAAATGGVVLVGSVPTRAVDWGAVAGPSPPTTQPTSVRARPSAAAPSSTPVGARPSAAAPPSIVEPSTAQSATAQPTISVLPAQQSAVTNPGGDPGGPGSSDTGSHVSGSDDGGRESTGGQRDAAIPSIPPSPAIHLWIPAIAVDAQVIPVDSKPTGTVNAWGGEIYAPIDFPVDRDVRQWIRRGDPNSVPAAEAAGTVRAFDRTVLYGHASDIGNHLIFQDLSALTAGDAVTVDTALGRFVYTVTAVVTRAKATLDNLAALYDYPTGGRKELALVACLPDATSNVVVFATLASAKPLAN